MWKSGTGGNINGYICYRSVLLFGFSSLAIIYGIVPILKKISNKVNDKSFTVISRALGLLFAIDVILYMIIK